MFKPFTASNDLFELKPLQNDQEQIIAVTEGLLKLFSDRQVLMFHPEKLIEDISKADKYVMGTLLGYSKGLYYNYFISDKKTKNVIGVIEILSPMWVRYKYEFLVTLSEEFPFINNTWLMEYYLSPQYWNRGIVTGFANLIVEQILSDFNSSVSAITNENNLPSKLVLEKLSFKYFKTYNKGNEHWVRIN